MVSTTLTPEQKSLLEAIKNLPSPFEGISKLADLEGITGVSLVIADKADLDKILDLSIERMIGQMKSSYDKHHNDPNNGRRIIKETEEDLSKRRLWAENQKKVGTLLGLYTRKLLWFDNAKPIIYLFADNIKEYAQRHHKDEDNVFAYVFIHEMMHAYYDAFYNEGFPSRERLEEAFAEFGMLTFINKSGSSLPGKLLADACDHVQSKIIPGPSQYGFGYDLFNLTSGGNPKMIARYKDISNKIDLDVIKNWNSDNKYFEDIELYPHTVGAQKCFDGVKEILAFDWGDPCFILQPGIRGYRARLPRATPRLCATDDWAVTASQIGWDYQYPLMKTDDLAQLLEEIIKVMKKAGFESSLSFDRDQIMFLGRPFSNYSTAPSRLNFESLCVKGTTVFPDFKYGLCGAPGTIGNILYSLGTLFAGVFTITHEGTDFVLYGPYKCVSLFPTGSTIATTGIRLQRYYSINGQGHFSMRQVIEEYIKFKLDEGTPFNKILRNPNGSPITHIGSRFISTVPNGVNYNKAKGEKPYSFNYFGQDYYISTQLRDKDPNCNVWAFRIYVNITEPKFQIKVIP